jgi:hypothetical protein
VIPQLEPLASDFNELALVVGPEPADVIEAARKHLVVEIEAATNYLVWHHHEVVVLDELPVAMTFYPEFQVISEIRAAGRSANKLQEKSTLGIGVIVSRKPFVVPKSARPIPQQVITEEPDPDARVSSYCPKSGPHRLRHSAIRLQGQKGGDDRSDRRCGATQSDLSSEGSTCVPCGASDLSNPQPFHQ